MSCYGHKCKNELTNKKTIAEKINNCGLNPQLLILSTIVDFLFIPTSKNGGKAGGVKEEGGVSVLFRVTQINQKNKKKLREAIIKKNPFF